jgi:hypothetical protein
MLSEKLSANDARINEQRHSDYRIGELDRIRGNPLLLVWATFSAL